MDGMKRLLVVFVLVSVLAPAVGAAGVAKARVWVSAESPLAVRGTGFKPRERVTVTVTAVGKRFVRVVTATVAGSFTARWSGSATDNGSCVSVFVRANGDRGSSAVWKSVANDCANGPTP
jgi:hypothetical protein